MMLKYCALAFIVCQFVATNAVYLSHPAAISSFSNKRQQLAAVMPGDPMVSAVVFQGLANAVKLYSNIILFRIALSWFPQLPRQFPILRPVFTVTEPYLGFFRKQIPAIGGFDISAIPAIFLLDIMSQTTVAIGCEFPENFDKKKHALKSKKSN
eukprot:gene7455-15248_t